jgi:hypothetical protein
MQSRTADRGWYTGSGLGDVLTIHRKNLRCYETYRKAWTWTDLLATQRVDEGQEFLQEGGCGGMDWTDLTQVAGACERGNELTYSIKCWE